MSDRETTRAKRDYFRSCVLALGTAALGLANPRETETRGLVVVGVLAVFVFVAAYYQVIRPSEGDDEAHVSLPRLRKMALLWYVATIVLGAALVREPLLAVFSPESGDPSTLTWILGAIGLGAVGYAVWKIAKRGVKGDKE